jgi:hypothetical protein
LNCEEGRKWLTKAAENGWPKAELLLFRFTFNGFAPSSNCPAYSKDTATSIKWLRRAADHGDVEAGSLLAVMLLTGKTVEKDLSRAEELLRNSAELGLALAQNDLGFAILNGDVTAKDPIEAAVWCKLAVLNSSTEEVSKRAKVNLSNALSGLTAPQQQEVETRVKKFKPKPTPPVDPNVKDWQRLPGFQPQDGAFGH